MEATIKNDSKTAPKTAVDWIVYFEQHTITDNKELLKALDIILRDVVIRDRLPDFGSIRYTVFAAICNQES